MQPTQRNSKINAAFPPLPLAEARVPIRQILEEVGLSDPDVRMRQHPHQMSGGIPQRIAIVAARLAEPRQLIADTPTTALARKDRGADSRNHSCRQNTTEGRKDPSIYGLSVVELFCARIAVVYAGEID
ncbi:ATP-binding cassette domain-containing protein, partial [Rhodovulum sulfidophilum]|nr:ATP-binding cassette domain-containing protein [Rhodovulum sulfidophilum]